MVCIDRSVGGAWLSPDFSALAADRLEVAFQLQHSYRTITVPENGLF